MTPERARELLRISGGFAPSLYMTPCEIEFVLNRIPFGAITLADEVRRIAALRPTEGSTP
jgi:hypothetical protein